MGTGRGVNGDGRRLDLGGEHTIQNTDDVLQNCTLETYIILLTSVTPINSIKNMNGCRLIIFLSNMKTIAQLFVKQAVDHLLT